LSVELASLRQVIERWSRDQVLALAPDASSQKAAQGVAAPGKWSLRGTTDDVLFGECKGSGATPYMACVDLSEPAYRCSCPSRKFPCKHALGLLLMWSADGVPAADSLPPWAAEWIAQRTERADKAAAKLEAARARAAAEAESDPESADGQAPDEGQGAHQGPEPGTASGSEDGHGSGVAVGGAGASSTSRSGGGRGAGAESVRHARVSAGLAELERWLADQVRQGLAGTDADEWDDLAKRLVDAQAPGVANALSRLREVRMADDWPSRLLAEYSLINLLAVAYRRRAELPGPLRQTVLIRAGFPVAREDVLVRPVVRDRWHVVGRRDEEHDRLTARRVWLRGHDTGRVALVLSFAASGQPLDASLVTGTTIDADVAFYPGAAPLRALVATRHATADLGGRVAPGTSPEEALGEIAAAVAADPWTDSWPVVLAGVVPGRTSVGGFPLHPRSRDPWRLIAVSGGRPVTVAAEWTPQGLRPLTTWADDGTAVIL
jgi:hypothetical protein